MNKNDNYIENLEEIKELRLLQEQVDEVLEKDNADIERLWEDDPRNVTLLIRSGFLMLSGFIDAYIEGLKRQEESKKSTDQ